MTSGKEVEKMTAEEYESQRPIYIMHLGEQDFSDSSDESSLYVVTGKTSTGKTQLAPRPEEVIRATDDWLGQSWDSFLTDSEDDEDPFDGRWDCPDDPGWDF